MKIEQILVLHLFNTKQLSLQGIGSFTLDPSISAPQENDKDIVLPESAISFLYNPKVTEDDALINTIVANTKKIKPLASADLDSYLMLGRQFLNIGKPFTIEGLGTLDKTQQGDLEFIPGQFITPKISAPKALKENENEVVSGFFQDSVRERNTGDDRKLLVLGIAILLLGLGSWAIWHFVIKKPVTKAEAVVPADSVKDSVVKPKDTVAIIPAPVKPPSSDGYSFKIVFKVTPDKAIALKAMVKMKTYGHKVILYSGADSIYKVAEPFKLPLSDTTRIKDSLNKYYYVGKAFVEL